MNKILEYKFDHDQKMIFEKVQGEIAVKDIIKYEKAKFRDPEHNDSYNIYVDLRGAIFNFSDKEKERIYSLLKHSISKLKMNRKCAFIADKPLEVAFTELFRLRMQKMTSMKFRIFTTEEAAISWLES